MICILIAIGVSILFDRLYHAFDKDSLEILSRLVLVVGMFIGMLVPGNGYFEPKEQANILLAEIQDDNLKAEESKCYVCIQGKKAYKYNTEVESKYTLKSSDGKNCVLIADNVKIIEDATFKDATLTIYEIKAKSSFWFWAVFCDKTEYVFYVPVGTVR